MTHQGFADLKSASDLFVKLTKDYQRIVNDETDPYCAFDFFVTAYHMIDWIHPDNKTSRRELEQSEALLRLCSHIANGAKHFKAKAPQHKSVSSLGTQEVWSMGSITETGWKMGKVARRLQIELDGEARVQFGETITVRALAEQLLDFWRQKLDV